jgi:hypothetical protein
MYTVIREKIEASLADTKGFIRYTWQAFWSKEHSRPDRLLIFSLALVLGIGCKAIAIHTITIGNQDYTLTSQIPPTLFVDTKEESLKGGPICEE